MVTGMHSSTANPSVRVSRVNLILASISNNISTSPAVSSVGQAVTGQCGGFASTFAAAQTSLPGPSAASAPVPPENIAGTSAVSNVNSKGTGNFLPRKPGSISASAIGNSIVPPSISSLASQMVWSNLPASQLPSVIIEGASFQNGAGAGTSVSASRQLAPLGATLNGSAAFLAPPVAVEPVGNAPVQSATNVLLPNQIDTQSNDQPAYAPGIASSSITSSIVDSITPTTSSVILPSAARGNPTINFKNELVPNQLESAGLEATPPAVPAETPKPPAASGPSSSISPAPVLNTTQDIFGNGVPANVSEPSSVALAPEPLQAAIPPVANLPDTRVLLASTFPQDVPEGGARTLNLNVQSSIEQPASRESNSTAVTSQPSEQSNVPAPVDIGDLFGLVSAPIVTSSILNTQVPPVGQPSSRPVATKVVAAISAPSPRLQAPTSTSTAAIATQSEMENESLTASQSPFSVFFSSPGPGTESAASTLPKMILPVASSVSHGGFAAVPSTANPQTSGTQGSVSQPMAVQPIKDALSGSSGGSSNAGAPTQPLHVEPTTTAPSLAIAQATAAASAAGLSAPIAVIAAGQSVITAESLPKQAMSSELAASVPTSPVPATPQALPTALPGPVQMAQLVDRMGQSEMRVGMNTSAFGTVEVRTTIHASDVGMTIGSEKGDLRGLLANDIPAIANGLQQQNLRLNSVNFMQGFGFSNNNSGGGDPQQRSFAPTPVAASFSPPAATPEDSSDVVPGELGRAGNSLSILA